MENVEFEHIQHLLKAPSKDVVIRMCNEAFIHRCSASVTKSAVDSAANTLNIDNQEAKNLLWSLRGLVKNALYKGSTDPSDVVQLFPGDFHKNLRDLLGKIIIENLPKWKEMAINDLVSLPRLVDFDWRVDVKSSSSSVSRMAVPSCILQLQVEENTSSTGTGAAQSNVNVELSKETLDTMLDGLGKIRDQLSSVARKT